MPTTMYGMDDLLEECLLCEKKINPMQEPIVVIRIEYPYGPTFHKKWCFNCYLRGRDVE